MTAGKKRVRPVSFKVTKQEAEIIRYIVDRALRLGKFGTGAVEFLDMDITACHANGCKLDLLKLLGAPNTDFMHDVCGIRDYLDRNTGKLTRCFLPRTAKLSDKKKRAA